MLPGNQTTQSQTIDTTAGTDKTVYIMAPFRAKLEQIDQVGAAVATDSTDYLGWTVKKGSTTLVTGFNTSAASITAGRTARTIVATGKDLEFDEGDVITIAMTNAGSGKAYVGDFVATWEPIRI